MILALGIVYVIVGIITVSLVLLHSGRGGGLSDMFGGDPSFPAQLATTRLKAST
ncbi:MAG: preprotein translocase subunit SecG, partial [Actinomycetota bacterium]